MEYRYSQRTITSMVNFLMKNMKFCTLVFHDIINDISYDAKLNRKKCCYFGGKIVKQNSVEKKARNGKIFVVSLFVDILVCNFAQW